MADVRHYQLMSGFRVCAYVVAVCLILSLDRGGHSVSTDKTPALLMNRDKLEKKGCGSGAILYCRWRYAPKRQQSQQENNPTHQATSTMDQN